MLSFSNRTSRFKNIKFCCWKIEILSPSMYSPQIRLSLGRLKWNISFVDGMFLMRVYIMFQINVLFFIVLTRCWTAFVSGETREHESHHSFLCLLMGDDLSLHIVCSGRHTVTSEGKRHLAEAIDLWKRGKSWFQDWDLIFYIVAPRERIQAC